MSILTWSVPLVSPIFLKRSLIFPILLFHYFFPLFTSTSFHCSLKTFLSHLDILGFIWVYISLYIFLIFLHSYRYIFPFLPCFSLLFFPQLFVKAPQITILLSCISFSLGWFWSLPPIQCYKSLSIVIQALSLPDLSPCIQSPPLYSHKGFDLGYTWMV